MYDMFVLLHFFFKFRIFGLIRTYFFFFFFFGVYVPWICPWYYLVASDTGWYTTAR